MAALTDCRNFPALYSAQKIRAHLVAELRLALHDSQDPRAHLRARMWADMVHEQDAIIQVLRNEVSG
jgi:hypothetical protein